MTILIVPFFFDYDKTLPEPPMPSSHFQSIAESAQNENESEEQDPPRSGLSEPPEEEDELDDDRMEQEPTPTKALKQIIRTSTRNKHTRAQISQPTVSPPSKRHAPGRKIKSKPMVPHTKEDEIIQFTVDSYQKFVCSISRSILFVPSPCADIENCETRGGNDGGEIIIPKC